MQNVLVLGASGYIGSQLIPLLLEQGYCVRAVSRHIDHLKMRVPQHPNLTIDYLDLIDKDSIDIALEKIDSVFFLVHGMAHGHDFIEYELALAQNFSDSVTKSCVKHVIYMSALQPTSGRSEHLEARKRTGEILWSTGIPITELRAGVVIGPGSAAFEIMRDFVYNLPIIAAPSSIQSKANPIALDNLNHYLLSLVKETPKQNRRFQVGGPDVLTYQEQFATIMHFAGKKRPIWKTSLLTPSLASRWLGVVTSVDASIGGALLAGIEHDYIADAQAIRSAYPQTLISYSDMVKATLDQEGEFVRSQVWGFEPLALNRWQPGFGYYPKQTGASATTNASAQALWQVITKLGSKDEGYFFANGLWRTREWLDLLFGGGKPIRRRPRGRQLEVGDYIDSWKVIVSEEERFFSLLFGMKGPGLGRLEFTIKELGDNTRQIEVNAWWHPQGFRGLLYWFAMMPAHLFIFKGMVRAIVTKAEQL
ncbi:DUF2867 domain-containing protein [Vibrio sp. SCSIO 43136]|uniref:DUF2867 domain-containing protein n=1 Tax=Vibrio sp. SCSIO 43136 TaxID=2819101 RepID=UPI002074E38A|nr:DUF2867 domain-containing protein [Vibrio sp. SCSIO 43136]USD66678.1 DUF2867 domain-containing protein [Vibrio sp. SCSIO 43136]